MATRRDIIEQIKSDLQDNLTTANSYNIQPVVIQQGNHNWIDFRGNMPSVHFCLTEDNPYESEEYPGVFGGGSPRALIIFFYGHAESDDGDSEVIYQMAEDMETFLESSHFTYSNETYLLGTKILEGGVSNPVTSFSVQAKIIYT